MGIRRYLMDREWSADSIGDDIPDTSPGADEDKASWWSDGTEYGIAAQLIDSILDDEGWPTGRDVLASIRDCADWGDPWGLCAGWHFAICDVLYSEHSDPGDHGSAVWTALTRWEYRPGMGEPIIRPTPAGEGFEADQIRDYPPEALIAAGDVLGRGRSRLAEQTTRGRPGTREKGDAS